MPVAEGAGSVVAVILVGYVRTLSEIVPTVPRTAARTFRRASGACRITLEQSRRYPFSRLSGRPPLESLEAVLTYSQARKDLRGPECPGSFPTVFSCQNRKELVSEQVRR